MIDVIIYHNPDCGTSRNTLGLIRNAGIEPHVIEYLKCPPSRVLLKSLIARMSVSVRHVVRVKVPRITTLDWMIQPLPMINCSMQCLHTRSLSIGQSW